MRTSGTAVLAVDTITQATPLIAIYSLIARLKAFLAMYNTALCEVCLFKEHKIPKYALVCEGNGSVLTHLLRLQLETLSETHERN